MRIILLGIALTSSISFASGFSQFVNSPSKSFSVQRMESAPQSTCLDISGHWVGVCTDADGNKTADETKIQQDEFGIELWNREYSVNGVTDVGSRDKHMSTELGVYLSCRISNDKIELHMNGTTHVWEPETFVTHTGTGSFKIDSGELVLESSFENKSVSLKDNSSHTSVDKEVCRYQKQ